MGFLSDIIKAFFVLEGLFVCIMTTDTETDIYVPEPVTILNSSFCDAKQKATYFNAKVRSIKLVNKDAFSNCKLLLGIDLQANEIIHLHKDTFRMNSKLKYLYLSHNQIEYIEEDTFSSLIELYELHLHINKLQRFQGTLTKNLKNLDRLYLYHNEILDLDDTQLLKNIPSLKAIAIGNNEFTCERVETIIKTLLENKIELFIDENDKKVREYPVDTRNGIECISDDTLLHKLWLDKGNLDRHIAHHVLKYKVKTIDNAMQLIEDTIDKRLNEFQQNLNDSMMGMYLRVVILEENVKALEEIKRQLERSVLRQTDELQSVFSVVVIAISGLLLAFIVLAIIWSYHMYKIFRKRKAIIDETKINNNR